MADDIIARLNDRRSDRVGESIEEQIKLFTFTQHLTHISIFTSPSFSAPLYLDSAALDRLSRLALGGTCVSQRFHLHNLSIGEQSNLESISQFYSAEVPLCATSWSFLFDCHTMFGSR